MEPSDVAAVPLDGYTMSLRPSELVSVALGLAALEAPLQPAAAALAHAVSQLATNDRAPTWELAVRRYGRRKSLAQAAGEIGMDVVHAADLVAALAKHLAARPATER